MSKLMVLTILLVYAALSTQATAADTSNPSLKVSRTSQLAPGFVLYSYTGEAQVLLLNHKAHPVHRWNVDAVRARLLPDCSLLVVHGTDWGKRTSPWKELTNTIRIYDWNGAVTWEYQIPPEWKTGTKRFLKFHHDILKTKNGGIIAPIRTTLILKVAQNDSPPLTRRVRSDTIVEISEEGEIEWEWHLEQHVPISDCGVRGCKLPLEHPKWERIPRDWTHVNTVAPLPPNRWFDAGDLRFRPGNLMILPRNFWEVFIVDRSTKEVVWRYHGDYAGGLVAPHESHLIERGLPGAGNLLVFDNGGRSRKYSIVLEINPVTGEKLWSYEDPKSFYVQSKGSAHRLPNGNTFISGGATKRAFEVNRDGAIVWEVGGQHSVNRVRKYPPDYCTKLANLEK